MISIIYSTRNSNPEFKKQLLDSCFNKNNQIIEVVNNGIYSLSEAYNIGVKQTTNDIIVCCHDDIILSKNWDTKLLKDFKDNPDYAIIGKAGSLKMDTSGIYWSDMSETMIGVVWHQLDDKPKYLSSYSSKFEHLIEVVTIDGVFMAFDKTKVIHLFDEYFDGFHFYDHGMTIKNYVDPNFKYKIGITFSFDLIHKSAGATNDEFERNRLKFIIKYNDVLPIELPEKKIYWNHKNPVIPVKKQELISIIIPHIHNNPILFTCISSFLKSTTYTNFEIIIADTGSSAEVINEIKEFIKVDDRIKLISYDYYNFARINNDVVLNHINKDSKFFLFLNNDVEFLEDNDAISRMYETIISKNNIFSVGPRMYFSKESGVIQFGGMFAYTTKDSGFQITHHAINTSYSYYKNNTEVIGNTGACLLVRRNSFERIGMFNEKYTECFEDCEANFKSICAGYKNLFIPDAVIIHHESMTRNNSDNKLEKLQNDYKNNLLPFVQANFEKLKGYIHQV